MVLERLKRWLFGGSADDGSTPETGVDGREAAEAKSAAETVDAGESGGTDPEPDTTDAAHECEVCGTAVEGAAGSCPLCGSSDVRAVGDAAATETPETETTKTGGPTSVRVSNDGPDPAERLRETRLMEKHAEAWRREGDDYWVRDADGEWRRAPDEDAVRAVLRER